jgi:hypothetical protein
MANVNNDVTVTLSQEDKELLIKAIKKCDQIAKDCNYNCDMFIDAGIVFAEISDEYKNGELPTVIHLYE